MEYTSANARRPADDAADLLAQRFKALLDTLVHEVRTPLSALAGEVELALRRDRSPAAYRDALSRIAGHATDLIDLTSDLALLAECEQPTARSQSADLQLVISQLSKRYDPNRIELFIAQQPGPVAGDERLLGRALKLIIDHALRHGGPAAAVRLRTEVPATSAEDGVDLIVDVVSPGLTPWTWPAVAGDADNAAGAFDQGLVRVRAAWVLIPASGGMITTEDAGDGASRLRIRLRYASSVLGGR